MIDPILKSPNLNLAADSNQYVFYKRDAHNYVTQLFGEQLPAIKNGFFNVYLSKGIIVQPHWHPNATEMVVVIRGEVVTAVFNPFTQKVMAYYLKPGQVAVLPQGWFHWIIAETNDVYALTIFDVPTPDVVLGSDFLRCIPKEVLGRAYCINEEDYARAIAPLHESVILGPPLDCGKYKGHC